MTTMKSIILLQFFFFAGMYTSLGKKTHQIQYHTNITPERMENKEQWGKYCHEQRRNRVGSWRVGAVLGLMELGY